MSMKQWIDFTTGSKHRRLLSIGGLILRIAYYYLILLALFVLYFVQRTHTPAPYIYSNF